jgi:tetratricopeptide (TPR) repeat protein
MLQQAVQLDPGFADAYGWLAFAQIRTYQNWHARDPETLRQAIANTNLALSKDPHASIAIRALVEIHHETGREVEGLLTARRALESSPDDLDVIAAAAEAYWNTGLYDRAIPLYQRALAGEPANAKFRDQLVRMYLYLGQYKSGLDIISPLPLSQVGIFGMMLYAETGHMAKAVEIARNDSIRVPVTRAFVAYTGGYVLEAAGDHAGAREVWARGVRYGEALLARNGGREVHPMNGMIWAKLGRKEEALRNARESLAPDPHHPLNLFFAAQIRALLGLRREALDTLKAAVENGFFNLPMIEFHSRPGLSFHALRDDPEFAAIRADLGRRIDDLRARY